MATSSNANIQNLMDEVESIDANDPNMLDKLNMIAQKVAEEQRKVKAVLTGTPIDDSSITDPSDAFACDGCQ